MSTHQYWSERYQNSNTPWDIGSASPPLTAFFQKLTDKNQKILIPGAGNSYEAEWLWRNGFRNFYVMDVAPEPLQNLKKRVPELEDKLLLEENFFEHHNTYDLIVEQTFFCALQPEQRKDYTLKMKELLKPEASLLGVLFDFPLTEKGPPFGGNMPEYQHLFGEHFKIEKLERCYNSIKPRQGSELFFKLLKP